MIPDLSAQALIRSGSGLLYVALGVFILTRRPRSGFMTALGAHFTAFGLFFAAVNVVTDQYWWMLAPLSLLDAVALWYVLARLRAALPDARAGALRRLAATLVGVQAALIGAAWPFRDHVDFVGPVEEAYRLYAYLAWVPFMAAWTLTLCLIPTVVEHVRARLATPQRAEALLLLAGVGALDFFFYTGQLINYSIKLPTAASFASNLLFLVPLPLAFALIRAPAPHRRLARIQLAALALALACGSLFDLYADNGAIGVVRIFAFAMLVFAVFQRDLLNIHMRPRTFGVGALTAAGLALITMTAQLAESMLSERMGVMAGGLVAGLLLFGAWPLERRLEGHARRRSDRPPADIYRAQASIMWRDGHLTVKERTVLNELSTRLGLSATEAAEIETGLLLQGRSSKRATRARPARGR